MYFYIYIFFASACATGRCCSSGTRHLETSWRLKRVSGIMEHFKASTSKRKAEDMAAEDTVNTVIFADSYLIYKRIKNSERIEVKKSNSGFLSKFNRNKQEPTWIKLSPHQCNGQSKSLIFNKSIGGGQFPDFLSEAKEWVRLRPRLTIIHLGACDIANSQIGRSDKIRSEYPEYVKNFLDKLIEKGAESLLEEERQGFLERLAVEHTFLLLSIPDWGPAPDLKPGSLQGDALKKARQAANSGMKKTHKPTLWNKYRVVLYNTAMDQPHRDNLHYAPESQTEYVDQIMHVAAKVLCNHCKPQHPDFKKEEHKHNYLFDQKCSGRPHNPQ